MSRLEAPQRKDHDGCQAGSLSALRALGLGTEGWGQKQRIRAARLGAGARDVRIARFGLWAALRPMESHSWLEDTQCLLALKKRLVR